MRLKTCVLGLGLMGSRAAIRLAEKGHDVVAWNRTALTTGHKVATVSTLASSPCEAVKGAAVVLLFLHNADAVCEVLLTSGASKCLAVDSLVADMGTNTPEAARHVASQLPTSVRFVDAPVSGGTQGVEQGTLSIFLGARDEDVPLVRSALGDLGQISHMGELGVGQAAKLANQIVVACSIAGLAEGVAFGEALGLRPDVLIRALRGGLADSRVLETIGERISADDFTPHGRAATHLKDLDCAFSQVAAAADSLRAASTAQDYLATVVHSFGDLDHSAMVLAARAALSGSADFPGSDINSKPPQQGTRA